MRLIRRVRDIVAFDAFVAERLGDAVFALPLSALGRSYYDATLPETREEISFLIEHDGRALAIFVADLSNGNLGRYGMPAELLLDRRAQLEIFDRALSEAMGEIGRIIRTSGVAKAEVLTASPGENADAAASQLMAAGFEPAVHLRAFVPLDREAGERESALRKGHRQALRWGNENLTLQVVDLQNPDRENFEAFRQLHCEVVGRATRNEQSWNVMFEAVRSGQGRLVLSKLDSALVGGTLILDCGATAIYASGAYRREHFDKPLAHYPLMVAMDLSRKAGRAGFDIGDVSLSSTMSPKERSIAYFKRGFTNRLKVALRYGLALPPPAREALTGSAP